MNLDLDAGEIELLRMALRRAIEANPFPLSPEVKALEALRDKIEAQAAAAPAPTEKKKPRR